MKRINLIKRQLEVLLSDLPPSRERGMVARWLNESNKYAASREIRLKVLAAVRDGFDTTNQIMEETGIPLSTLYKILQRLELEGSIEKRKCRRTGQKVVGSSIEYRFSLNIR